MGSRCLWVQEYLDDCSGWDEYGPPHGELRHNLTLSEQILAQSISREQAKHALEMAGVDDE